MRLGWVAVCVPAIITMGAAIEAFSARLRDEIDIDALGAELAEITRRTMHPSSVSVWIRGQQP